MISTSDFVNLFTKMQQKYGKKLHRSDRLKPASCGMRSALFPALIASLALGAVARAEIKAPQPDFEEYLVAPVHVHLLVTPGELNLSTTLKAGDIERIFGKVNRIWGHAAMHIPVAKLITEPAANPVLYRQNHKSRNLKWLLGIRPEKTIAKDCFHLYYIKRFAANGVYIGGDGMFVKDLARLRGVDNGMDEPIPRVTSHEIGHAFTLRHRQDITNLMASGTSGWTLNAKEIHQARTAAGKLKWIRAAPAILKEADALHEKGDKKAAAALYKLIAGIPLNCPETSRAKRRATK